MHPCTTHILTRSPSLSADWLSDSGLKWPTMLHCDDKTGVAVAEAGGVRMNCMCGVCVCVCHEQQAEA